MFFSMDRYILPYSYNTTILNKLLCRGVEHCPQIKKINNLYHKAKNKRFLALNWHKGKAKTLKFPFKVNIN